MSASKIPASLEYERRSDAISVASWWGRHNGLWAGAAPEFSYQWGIAVCWDASNIFPAAAGNAASRWHTRKHTHVLANRAPAAWMPRKCGSIILEQRGAFDLSSAFSRCICQWCGHGSLCPLPHFHICSDGPLLWCCGGLLRFLGLYCFQFPLT